MAISEIKVGPAVVSDGAQITARASRDSALVVTDAHSRYQEMVFRGNVFSASNQAGVATPAGLVGTSTAVTGFQLYNPIASGKNLVLIAVDITPTVAIATAIVGNMGIAAFVGPNLAAPTGTTALTVYNNLINSASTNVGKALSTMTSTQAPVAFKNIAYYQRDSAAASNMVTAITSIVEGGIILPPGTAIAIFTLTAITIQTSMTWEEIPI